MGWMRVGFDQTRGEHGNKQRKHPVSAMQGTSLRYRAGGRESERAIEFCTGKVQDDGKRNE